jgi:hypothetical protein
MRMGEWNIGGGEHGKGSMGMGERDMGNGNQWDQCQKHCTFDDRSLILGATLGHQNEHN